MPPEGRGRQLRQPRLAEIIAAALRERIVSGQMGEGDTLPGLDRLVEEFGVSPPSLREALRILENEGLITVRRGNLGGAVVHRPTAEGAAYMFGLVLQAEDVPVVDLASALGQLESLCARMCAARTDRRRAVVPALARVHRLSESVLDDGVAFEQACRDFHDGLITLCGNRSIELAVSAFEWLWRQQQEGWAHRVAVLHEYPDPELRREGLVAHAEILAAIEQGDPAEAARLTTEHLEHPRIRGVPNPRDPVRATDIRRGPLGPAHGGTGAASA
jgi:DNA-binding FadR family transcriptional regulator